MCAGPPHRGCTHRWERRGPSSGCASSQRRADRRGRRSSRHAAGRRAPALRGRDDPAGIHRLPRSSVGCRLAGCDRPGPRSAGPAEPTHRRARASDSGRRVHDRPRRWRPRSPRVWVPPGGRGGTRARSSPRARRESHLDHHGRCVRVARHVPAGRWTARAREGGPRAGRRRCGRDQAHGDRRGPLAGTRATWRGPTHARRAPRSGGDGRTRWAAALLRTRTASKGSAAPSRPAWIRSSTERICTRTALSRAL